MQRAHSVHCGLEVGMSFFEGDARVPNMKVLQNELKIAHVSPKQYAMNDIAKSTPVSRPSTPETEDAFQALQDELAKRGMAPQMPPRFAKWKTTPPLSLPSKTPTRQSSPLFASHLRMSLQL